MLYLEAAVALLLPISTLATINQTYRGWDSGNYTFYQDDGSEIQGWPAMSNWLDYETLWQINYQNMLKTCGWGTPAVPNNDPDLEMSLINLAVLRVAAETKVDPRFILATILQESEGCVRVKTTQAPGSVLISNPGLMQTHNGAHSCNQLNNTIFNSCPWGEILGMVQDGTAGTESGDGLASCLDNALNPMTSNGTLLSCPLCEAQAYYLASRLYNSGSFYPNGDLGAALGATTCYSSAIANRLRGWTNSGANTTCTLANIKSSN